MGAAFVLVHSPLVGPATWAPVARVLEGAGVRAVVPSLTHVADAGPPFWPVVVDTVAAVIDQLPREQSVVIVSHSNAGLFVPVIVEAAARRVAGCLFVDARVPAPEGPARVTPPEFLEFLRAKVTDGRLPQWSAWWDESEVAPLFPDPRTRAAVSAEQPRLPLSYYEESIPVPAGWDDRPCGYLLFGPPYESMAQDARERGWAVDHVPGLHLHQLMDPETVASRILAMTSAWRSPGP